MWIHLSLLDWLGSSPAQAAFTADATQLTADCHVTTPLPLARLHVPSWVSCRNLVHSWRGHAHMFTVQHLFSVFTASSYCFSWEVLFFWGILKFQLHAIFLNLQAIFPEPQPRKSDVFHLAANLLDRYLGYHPPSTEGEFRTVAMACTMISVKLRMSREEVFGPSSLQHIFYDVLQNDVIVSE